MKTKLYLVSSLFLTALSFTTYGQATQATNAVANANSYLGTSNNFDVLFKRQAINAGLISTSGVNLGLNSGGTGGTISLGTNSGRYSTGVNCINIGNNTGSNTSYTGSNNILMGFNNYGITSGSGNIIIGSSSVGISTGSSNTIIGVGNGLMNSNGSNTNLTYLGSGSGNRSNGNNNTYLGVNSGKQIDGSNNVMLGYNAGAITQGVGQTAMSNMLFIENSNSATPLIWGDFANDQVKPNGKVGVGAVTAFPTMAGGVNVSAYKLFVTGGILTDEVRVNASAGGTWADYVFNKDYNLKSLDEVEQFINENGHLPNVPSAKQIQADGIALGEMAKIQQEKIEELTLYIIELNKKLEQQGKMIQELQNKK